MALIRSHNTTGLSSYLLIILAQSLTFDIKNALPTLKDNIIALIQLCQLFSGTLAVNSH